MPSRSLRIARRMLGMSLGLSVLDTPRGRGGLPVDGGARGVASLMDRDAKAFSRPSRLLEDAQNFM